MKYGKPTAVSHIIRRFDEQAGERVSRPKCDKYDVVVASDSETRERAAQLAYAVYRKRGLIDYHPSGMVLSEYDGTENIFTLLFTETETGKAAATVSLVLDEKGLPCDEAYSGEMDGLRRKGERAAEVIRLAIHDRYRRDKSLLIRMFNLLYIFARRIWSVDAFVIEVNPRHTCFYTRKLLFEEMGGQKPCARVKGEPAVLLKVDLSMAAERLSGYRLLSCRDKEDRTVYPDFILSLEQEAVVAEFLFKQYLLTDTYRIHPLGAEQMSGCEQRAIV